MAPVVIERTVSVAPERAFSLASDFANAPARISGIRGVRMLTDPPVGLGTRFEETRVVFGREATETMQVTAFEPPHRYVLETSSHGTSYRSELRFAPEGDGTRISMTFEARPETLIAHALAFVTRPMAKKVRDLLARDLDELARACEGDEAATVAAAG